MKKEYTLDSIAGYETEKEELRKIIELFNNYDEYKSKGAYLSKGLILSGEPGVGKTLFAKVLASEINAPIIILDGAELNGFFGAAKIKRAFKKAAKKTPSMIFIDELNLFVGDEDYYSDFTKRNLSCLLKLIDGIKENNDIIVVGASSNKDDLDEALLRSGRMDKHICISLPNSDAREKIVRFYLEKINLESCNLNLKKVVELTAGLTGADIKTVVNEATLEAVKNNNCFLSDENIFSAITKIKNQDINRNNVVAKELVCHDIGHLIVLYDLFKKISDINTNDIHYDGNSSIDFLDEQYDIIEYYNDDYYDDDDEDEENRRFDFSVTKNNAIKLIAVKLAGMACEEVYLKDRSLYCYMDIDRTVCDIQYMMGAGFFGLKYSALHRTNDAQPLTGKIKDEIDIKREEILNEAYDLAIKIIKNNIEKVELLYNLYEKHNHIDKEDALKILKN